MPRLVKRSRTTQYFNLYFGDTPETRTANQLDLTVKFIESDTANRDHIIAALLPSVKRLTDNYDVWLDN